LSKGENFYTKGTNLGIGEESETKFISKFIPISIDSTNGMSIPFLCSSQKGERKQHPFNGLMFHTFNMMARTQMLNFPKAGIRIFIFVPREGLVPNHGYKDRTEFIARSCDRLR